MKKGEGAKEQNIGIETEGARQQQSANLVGMELGWENQLLLAVSIRAQRGNLKGKERERQVN